jgi:anti-anti-sigma factor
MGRIGSAGGAQASVDVQVDERGDATVTVAGELDVSNVDELAAMVEPLLDKQPARVRFDVHGLDFMDSSGIALFLRVAARVGAVQLLNPTSIVRRIVTSTGLADVLPMEP